MSYNNTVSSDKDSNLTYDDLINAHNLIRPVIYYICTKYIESGSIVKVPESDYFPEYIIFHPDDLPEIKDKLIGYQLVNIKEFSESNNRKFLQKATGKILEKFARNALNL